MKKEEVYVDLGQQNGFGLILIHIIRAISTNAQLSVCNSAKIFLTSKF
jgi:hypothetical protein